MKPKTESEKLETLDADIEGHRSRMRDEERLHLRDRAAERFAAALIEMPRLRASVGVVELRAVAIMAYDLADALMAERDVRRAKDGQ